jgi:hypothetical protein
MRLGNVLFGLVVAICLVAAASEARAQTGNAAPAPLPINPLTGPSFPCPQPNDPLAQLICGGGQLADLDMGFVQAYEALYQQAGLSGQASVRHLDLQFDLGVRTRCGIALSQAGNPSSSPPPAAPPSAFDCVVPAYIQQIAVWKSMLQGAALEEANRPIRDQLALQSKLQSLGFLPVTAQIDGIFGAGTRAAITDWQTSRNRQATGLLGNDDAQALLEDSAASASVTSNTAVQTPSEPQSPQENQNTNNSTNLQTVPAPLQGIWALDCTKFSDGAASSAYFVFGPSDFVLFEPSDKDEQVLRTVGAVQSGSSYAVSQDWTPGGQFPYIEIWVINVLGPNQIELSAEYNASKNSLKQLKDVIWSRCSPSSLFSEGLTQANQTFIPTGAEISASYKALNNMPAVNNVSWSDPGLTNNFPDQ